MTEQYIRYAAMFIIIMMAVIDDYRRFKVSNRIIIAGMVIGVVINMGSLMYGGDVRGYIYGGMAGFAIMYMVYIFGGVGSSYTLMTFLTSVIIGLCLGSSSFVSMAYGRKDVKAIRNGIFLSSSMIGAIAVVIMALFYILVDKIILLLQVPYEIAGDMKEYLIYVFIGFIAIYIYNYVSNILRGIGNSVVPLVFLSVSVVLNIFLDILFVAGFNMGIKGAAAATVIAQYISGIGIFIYMIAAYPEYRIHKDDMQFNKENITNIFSLSGFTCLQQSVMNFGILCVQGIVNSFGTVIMAAFAVAVKIDTIAYMPVQDFGNAFSVFVAQNYGAGQRQRIKKGIKQSVVSVIIFWLARKQKRNIYLMEIQSIGSVILQFFFRLSAV